ncbi:MAG: winged helix-turn-helix transcriptional regulator [Phycisphaerae bacterium]|nr:winged helix-turn-helix transcriptional regulator [Phycisphaerae bacterium]RZV40826.1 MAG: hypothetical protein EX269_17150 [Acidimicrobiales bacterium]
MTRAVILVYHFLGGRKRVGELRRLTPNATERMSTLQLREFEAEPPGEQGAASTAMPRSSGGEPDRARKSESARAQLGSSPRTLCLGSAFMRRPAPAAMAPEGASSTQ